MSLNSPNSASLFRTEAIAAQSDQFLGTIRIGTPPHLIAVAAAALGLVLALLSFAIWGQITRKTQVPGVLLPPGGVLQVSSPSQSRLRALNVHDGDVVQPGQVLAVLDLGIENDKGDTSALLSQSLQNRLDALQAEARSLQAQVHQREQALRDRLRSLNTDLVQAQGELEAAQRRSALAQHSLARDQGLAAQGFLSAAQVQLRQEELLDLQMRERTAQRNAGGLRREAQSLDAEIVASRLQTGTQQAQLDRTRAGLIQESAELSARHLVHLTAPLRATVGATAAHAGQSLQAGQTVLSLLPLAPREHNEPAPAAPALEGQLYAPSRTSGFVEPGQAVWFRLHAYPYQKFGLLPGRVVDVSRTPVLPQDLPIGMAQALLTAAQAQEPLYRITVALQRDSVQAFGKAQALKAGMTLDADVVQDRRAIWEWLLEPLLAAKQRWQSPSSDPKPTSPGGES